MSATDPSPTTLHGLAECIVVLPYQLGYRPQRSLVLVCLGPTQTIDSTSGRGAVALTARVDLPPAGQEHVMLQAVLPALRRHETYGIIAIVFDDDGHVPVRTQLLGQVAAMADSEHVEVCGLALVRGDHWLGIPVDDLAAHPTDSEQTHPESAPRALCGWLALPATRDVPGVATYVLAGRCPLPDRDGLAQIVQRSDSDLATATAARTARLLAAPSGSELTAQMTADAARVLGLVVAAEGGALPTGLSPDDLACCAVALQQVVFRDAVLESLVPGLLEPLEGHRSLRNVVRSQLCTPRLDSPGVPIRLAALAGHLPQDATPALLSIVGYLAWCRGEGALANIAIETALSIDPRYSLARLVDQALGAAVRPPGAAAYGAS